MNVYIELRETISVLHIRVSTIRRSKVACDHNYHDVITPACAAPVYMVFQLLVESIFVIL